MSLITNISQLRAASTINISNILANWQPYIDDAEVMFIRPVLGDDFYEELDDAVNGSGSGQSGYDELIEKVRKALALYALYLGIDEMNVSVSAAGVQTIDSPTHKPAAEYQILNLKESWLMRAHRHVDLFLKYLDANRDTFTGYTPVSHGCFIDNAEQFQQYIDINSSRRVFLQLIPVMKNVQLKYIRPALTSDLYDELVEAYNGSGSSPLSEDHQALIDLIRPALAHLTMVRALQEITLDILNWGSFAFAWSTFKSMKKMDEINKERVGIMMDANQRDGEAEMKELQEYLDNNASETKYKAYYDSDKYVGPDEAKTRLEFKNSNDNSIFCP